MKFHLTDTDMKLFCKGDQPKEIPEGAYFEWKRDNAVSYTHLDVYKRQLLHLRGSKNPAEGRLNRRDGQGGADLNRQYRPNRRDGNL